MKKIVWLVSVVFLLGSLLFGTLWAIFHKDVQCAFGISAWWVSSGGSLLALFGSEVQ